MRAFRITFRVILAAIVFAFIAVVLWMTQPVLRARPASPVVAADPKRLARHVEMLAVTCVPRDLAHRENLDRAADYVRDEFRAAGGRIFEQSYVADRKPVRNILALFGPEGGERIVVGAHYDAFGGMPGADDNASGVAGLLELARLLSQSSPRVTVELAAFTLEEPPYFNSKQMGSAVHVDSLLSQKVRVRAMLCLEMIGCFSDARGSQNFTVPALGLVYPTRGDFIAVAGRLGDVRLVRRVKAAMSSVPDLRVRSFNAPPRPFGLDLGTDLSDHANYWAAGIPAVMITDTAFFRNLRYHTAGDTVDQIDFGRMALVVSGVHQAVLALDGR